MLPEAPGRLSTTTCWPSRAPARAATRRAPAAVMPMRIASPLAAAMASASTLRRGILQMFVMGLVSLLLLIESSARPAIFEIPHVLKADETAELVEIEQGHLG